MPERVNGRRRILMTVDAVGGVWQYAAALARELAEGGDDVLLAGLGPEPDAEQRRELGDAVRLVWLKAPLEWMARREEDVEGLSAELARLADEHAIDVLHLNAPSQAPGLDIRCPVVAVSHSCIATWFGAVRGSAPPEGWDWQRRRNRLGFDRADIVVAPSRSHAEALRACYGEIASLAVVHNAARPLPVNDNRKDVVLAAGRWWDDGKNAQVLDAAAASSPWPVVAAGATRAPNGDAVAFRHARPLGSVPHAAMEPLMATCGIFVSPSIYEPFGLAALEAASAATPLVLADIPTYRELWDEAAIFFPPRDPDALALTLRRLAADAAERRRLGRAALARSRNFALSRQAEAMRSVYDAARSRKVL